MKKTMVVIGMVAVTGILYACGGSSSKSGGGGTTTVAAPAIAVTPTPISTQADVAKTVNVSKTLAASFASGSSFPSIGSLVAKPSMGQTADGHRIIDTVRDLQLRIAGIVEKQKVLGKQVAAAQSQACPDGGVMSFDMAGSATVIMTFAACKDGYEYRNGSISFPQALWGQTSSTAGGAISLNLTTISYAYGGYTTKEFESAQNLTMSVGSFDTAAGTASFSINGSDSNIDYLSGTSDKQSFGNFSLTMTETAGTISTVDMTINGAVSMDTFDDTTFTKIDTASGMAFKNLQLGSTMNAADNSTSITVNGTYAIKTIPACMDGTFVITTQTPITTNSSGTTGQMTVNGVAMVFNPDGTVTATINGVPQTITSYASVCSLSF